MGFFLGSLVVVTTRPPGISEPSRGVFPWRVGGFGSFPKELDRGQKDHVERDSTRKKRKTLENKGKFINALSVKDSFQVHLSDKMENG